MHTECDFYICPTCFKTARKPIMCHEHLMIHCDALPAGHELLKPPQDADGDMPSRAPRWFLEKLAKK